MKDNYHIKDFQRCNKKDAFAGFAGAAELSKRSIGFIQFIPEWEEG